MCLCQTTFCHIGYHNEMKYPLVMMGFVLQNGRSPLFSSSLNGHLDVVKTLIEAGANINQLNKVNAHITTHAAILYITMWVIRPTWTTII